MEINISVDNLPPKKDGANSMWRKSSELPRLKALRVAVLNALGGSSVCLENVELKIRIYADSQSGDLDNFITGICDGLMAAHPRTPIDNSVWVDVSSDVHPRKAIAFSDDAVVERISAERLMPLSSGPHYELEIRGHQ